MAIEKTEAIVLRAINYRDTSKIVTFYTKRYGKMSAIAKGARNPKSKFGSLFQPLNYLQIVFYRRENRQLQYVSSSDFVKYFKTLTTNVEKLSVAISLIEIVNFVMHDEDENESLFGLLVDSLDAIDGLESPREESGTAGASLPSPLNIFVHFGLHLAGDLGFAPSFENCLICGKAIEIPPTGSRLRDDNSVKHGNRRELKIVYVVEKGGPLCQDCSLRIDNTFLLSAPAFLILRSLARLSTAAAAKARMEVEIQHELSNFIFVYLRRHSGSLRELNALKFLTSVV